MTSTVCVKPPVILVVEGEKSQCLLAQIKQQVRSEKYLVYPATCTILTNQPWQDETELLVLGVKLNDDRQEKVLLRWLQNGGKVLDFASNLGCLSDNYSLYVEAGRLGTLDLGDLMNSQLGIEVAMEQHEVESLSPGFLVSSTKEFIESLPSLAPPDAIGLVFRPAPDMEPGVNRMPVHEAGSPDFSSSLYEEALVTRALGQVIHFPELCHSSCLKMIIFPTPLQVAVYVPCVGSTQLTLEKRVCHGATLVAGRQTQGKGRGGNAWISPLGCCMFSTQMLVEPGQVLASRPSIVQHLAALAVVQAVGQTTGVGLSIKWPNDIYMKSTVEGNKPGETELVKMGGVVVAASSNKQGLALVLGIGLNLDNASPTCSLNSVAEKQQGGNKVAREVLIASILNHLEQLVDLVEGGTWAQVEQEYYKAWLHTNQAVRVTDKEGREEDVVVVGIDKFGFLRVYGSGSGEEFTVFDDGNSFDMMAGLIRPKSRV